MVAVTVCVELLGAVGVAAAPSPTASPCGQGLAGVVCTVGGGAPPGGLGPAPPSSPTPAPPAPASRRPVPAAAPATSRPPAPAPSPTPSPNAGLGMVAASLRSAPYVGQLLDVLAHPVASTRPDLRHFQPPSGAAAATVAAGGGPAGAADPSRGGGRGVVALELIVAALAVALSLRRGFGLLRAHAAGGWRPALPPLPAPRPGWLLAAALAVVVPVSTDASLATRHRPEAPPHPPGAAAPPSPAPVARAVAAPAPGAPTAWSRLVGIERRLSDETGLLATQEWEIRRLAGVAGRHLDDPDQLPVGAASAVQERARLSSLLGAHQAATAAYHHDLQAEYDLYRSAASDPGQRAQLTAGAAAAPSPEAPVAVTSNLGLVATQLAQEAALADAQARLRQLGALLPAQMDAIRRHLPFIAPEVAPVSQGFGPTDLGIEPPLTRQGTFYPHFHTGIDIAAQAGTPLHAAADGVVLIAAASVDAAGRLVGYGNYVVVGHAAGFLTLYGHMSGVAVHSGDRVRQGEVIGFEGSTGNSTGPHVHFEIRQDGTLLDPAPLLAGQLPPG